MFAVGVLMGWGEKGNLEDHGNVARLAKGVEYSRPQVSGQCGGWCQLSPR